jgi:tetratricopeptide (TPR) repeat protein
MKPSRLLLRLEAGIRDARSTLDADCLRAERAGYLARLGHFDEVRRELSELHGRYDARPNVEISTWLNLVEGLVIHASELGQSARDKIQRAYALSGAAGLVRLRALSAAWLAHMDFLQVDIVSMALHVDEALTLSDQSQSSTRARANLVVAQGYHQGGRLDLALPWYFFARQHAISDGDDAMVSALMHNMAWLRASNVRQGKILGTQAIGENDHALISARSTQHYDLLVGTTNLQSSIPVLQAKLLAESGRAAEALAIFEKHLKTAIREGMSRLQADLVADQAWCKFQLGKIDEARQDAILAESSVDHEGQLDDRAFAHSRLAEIFSALGDFESAQRHQTLANIAWSEHILFQNRMVTLLNDMASKMAG